MAKKTTVDGKVPESLTLGTISGADGRRRAIPVIYYLKEGIVVTGIKRLGKAATLEEALEIAQLEKSFRQAGNLPKK